MRLFGIACIFAVWFLPTVSFGMGAGAQKAPKSETVALLEELRKEPLSKDATDDTPAQFDEALNCLTAAKSSSDTTASSKSQPEDNSGVQ